MFLLMVLVNVSFVTGIPNSLANGKPAQSSSNTNAADRAVDGNRDPDIRKGSCWEGDTGDMHPYWIVDLQGHYAVGHIDITNRGDCCSRRLHDLSIEVFAEDPVQVPTTPRHFCAHFPGPIDAGATETIMCSCQAHGRYVRIEALNRTHAEDRPCLCEVEVFERTANKCFNTAVQRLVDTRYVGDVVPVAVTSAGACATYCLYKNTCIGFNFNYLTSTCELRVGAAHATSAFGWLYFMKDQCLW